jgi:hypothetical protein
VEHLKEAKKDIKLKRLIEKEGVSKSTIHALLYGGALKHNKILRNTQLERELRKICCNHGIEWEEI